MIKRAGGVVRGLESEEILMPREATVCEAHNALDAPGRAKACFSAVGADVGASLDTC